MHLRSLSMSLLPLAAFSPAASAQDAIITDRPGFSTGPDTVARGVTQAELGFEWNPDTDAVTLPFALLRHGIGEATEVRLAWSGVVTGTGEAGTLGGGVEIKHTLREGEGASPTLGVLVGVNVPGDGGPLNPNAGFLWSSSLGDAWSVFGTATVSAPDTDTDMGGGRRFVGTNAVGVSRSLGKAGFFVEHFVSVTEGGDEETQLIDAGLTYLVTDDLQIDVNGGVSVGGADADGFVGAGLAYRF